MRISDWSSDVCSSDLDLRLPRALLALLVGGVLGLGGAAMQGYLHNPLAEPSVLGASNMAALGAVIAVYFCLARSEERRVGQACVSPCRSRWCLSHLNNTTNVDKINRTNINQL